VLALIAAALIARQPDDAHLDTPNAMGVGWSLCAGAFFGISLVLYVQTSSGSGLFRCSLHASPRSCSSR
jgi:hypothetical protein